MSQSVSKNAPHKPGTYAKGDDVRVATSVASAAALAFDGYSLQVEPALDAPKADPVSSTAAVKDKDKPKP